jgi:hypothetical protein
MANLIDADLLLDTFSERMETTLGPVLAPLNAFCKDFTTDQSDGIQQTKSLQIPVFNATAVAVQSNPTNFETGDTNTTNAIVTVNHLSRSFYLASSTLNQKFRIENLMDINWQVFANKIIDTALTPVTVTNFTANLSVAEASVAGANLATAWAGIGTAPVKNLLLSATAMSKFLPTNLTSYGSSGTGSGTSGPTTTGINLRGLYGFDNFYLNTRWTGAGTNVFGFACAPNAIGLYGGIPKKGPSAPDYIASRIVQVPQLGLSVEFNTWFSVASRQQWASYDVIFGAGYLQDTARGFVLQYP